MADDQPLDYIVLKKPEVYVYRIPPREPSGHRAEAWNESIWKGRLRVIGRGDTCIVRLVEADSDSLFANCIVSKDIERAVERTIDSSRYFVLRLDDGQGRHAFVGIGFSNRNDAFDFICAVNDFHQTQVPIDPVETKDSKKLALAEGENVKIRLKNISTKSRKSKESHDVAASSSSVSSILPPPPPPSSSSSRRSPQKDKSKDNESGRTQMTDGELSKVSSTRIKKESKKKKVDVHHHDNTEAFEFAFGASPPPAQTDNKDERVMNNSQPPSNNVRRENPLLLDVGDEIQQLPPKTTTVNVETQQKETRDIVVPTSSSSGMKQSDTPLWDAFSDEALVNWTASTAQLQQQQEVSNNPFADDDEDDDCDSSETPTSTPSYPKGTRQMDLYNGPSSTTA